MSLHPQSYPPGDPDVAACAPGNSSFLSMGSGKSEAPVSVSCHVAKATSHTASRRQNCLEAAGSVYFCLRAHCRSLPAPAVLSQIFTLKLL